MQFFFLKNEAHLHSALLRENLQYIRVNLLASSRLRILGKALLRKMLRIRDHQGTPGAGQNQSVSKNC